MINMKHLRVPKASFVIITLAVILALVPLSSKADDMQQSFTQPYPQSFQQPYPQQTYAPQQPLAQTPNQFVDNRYYQTNYYGQNAYAPGYGPTYPVIYGYGYRNDGYSYWRNLYSYGYRPSVYINANLGHLFGGGCRHGGFGFSFGHRGCGRRW